MSNQAEGVTAALAETDETERRTTVPEDIDSLVEQVRQALCSHPANEESSPVLTLKLRHASAALTELAERVKAAERERDRLQQAMHGEYDLRRTAEAQRDELKKAARDLYDDAGVDDIDQRLDYLVLQVTRDVWNDFVAVIDP